MDNEVVKTLVVATILCIVCSILVSGAAVLLKPMQDVNKELDVKKNLLLASGLIQEPVTKEEIETTFAQIKAEVIELATGEVADIDPTSFDQDRATKDPEMGMLIPADKDISGIKRRAKYAPVYKYIQNGKVEMLVLPVYGKGLWSTMYGFLAISGDLETIKGLGFYAHGETPGLGGEIDNPRWQALWVGKKIFNEDFKAEIQVIKGAVSSSTPQGEYKVDGLSGATITSNGVTNMLRYWLGPDGFGPYLKKFSEGTDSDNQEDTAEMEEGA